LLWTPVGANGYVKYNFSRFITVSQWHLRTFFPDGQSSGMINTVYFLLGGISLLKCLHYCFFQKGRSVTVALTLVPSA
jgi:hypothetical protein